jgi:LCP family protein required for cell wall assembly
MQPASSKRRWKAVAVWSLYGLLLLVMAAGGTVLGFVKDSELAPGLVRDWLFGSPEPEEVFGRGDITLLILGTDEDRAPGGHKVDREAARSDMIMVARLHFDKKTITGITIPRDTLAQLPGYSTRRVNAFHAFGGPDLAERAVEGLIGVKIDRTVVVNYRIFQDMVDMIGGIDIDVEKKLTYSDERGNLHIDLEPGPQHLDGYSAMGYVRYRRDGDFERQRRQRSFLLAFKAQAMKNPRRAPQLIDHTTELIGGVFSNEELRSLIGFSQEVKSTDIKLGVLPVLDAQNFDLVVDSTKLYDTLLEYELVDG